MSGHAATSILHRPRRGPGATSLWGAATELMLGAGLLGLATMAGLVFVHRPWPNRVDSWVDHQLAANYSSAWAHHLTTLGSKPVFVAVIAVIFVVGLTRDWVRAVACAIGPLAAEIIVEKVAKPLVDRHFGMGGSTYPSGTVAAVVALTTAAILVAPRVARAPLFVLGLAATLAVSAAVVVLRWHYPTDALGGMAVGAGSVLALDGLLHLPWALARWSWRWRGTPLRANDRMATPGAVPG